MDILKLKAVILFILTLFNLALSFLLLKRGRKDKVIFHLGITAFFSALYAFICGLNDFFWGEDYSYEFKLFLARASWSGVLMLPAYLTFVYYFTVKTRHIKLKTFFWYLGAVIINGLALTTSYFVKKIHTEYPNIVAETPGFLEPLGRFYILLALIIGLIYLLKEYFQQTGFRKLQIKYLILGITIYAIGGIFFTGILPLFQKRAPYYDVAALFSCFFLGLVAYAILRYRLLNLQVVFGRTAVYILSSLSMVAIAFLMIFLNKQTGAPFSTNLVIIIALIIITLSYQSLFRFFEKIAGRYFYYTFYTLTITLESLTKKLNQTIKLDKLTSLISRSILDALKLDKIAIFLRHPKTERLPGTWKVKITIKLKERDLDSLLKKENNFLIRYFRKTKKVLVKEEIPFILQEKEKEEERGSLKLLKEDLDKLEIGIILPLLIEEELIGLLVLGNKLSGEGYTVQEINLLTVFIDQAAIAFNNALSYEEIEKRKEELQHFYDVTVGRELKMIELKKKIKELEEKLQS